MQNKLFLIASLIALSCTTSSDNGLYSKTWTEDDRNYLVTNLKSTLNAILRSVEDIDNHKWNWKPDSTTWSVAMIVEHLITHDELFYRELQIMSNLPEMTPLPAINFAPDDSILSYREVTAQNKGTAPAYLEPQGRWCSKNEAITAFSKVRTAMIILVQSTDADLRKYYTRSGRGPTLYRDIHQLMLISIAHTERHHAHIQRVLSQ